jgi:hypothetical protein
MHQKSCAMLTVFNLFCVVFFSLGISFYLVQRAFLYMSNGSTAGLILIRGRLKSLIRDSYLIGSMMVNPYNGQILTSEVKEDV